MAISPSCNNVDGKGLPVLGDGPFDLTQLLTAQVELLRAFGSAVFDIKAEQREVYKQGTEARRLARVGIHFGARPDEIETVTMYQFTAQSRGWNFRRAWYYWVCEGSAIPMQAAAEFNTKWGTQVRVNGYAGGTDVDGPVCSYHVDTFDGLVALAGLIGVQTATNS